jgi:uncharacterized protein (DUF58 family)
MMLAAERAATSVLSGEHRQHKSGTGERFWQFREYDPSDRPQDIDWRQSGKGDRVFVRQNEWQTTQTLLFWLQGDRGMNFRSAPALPFKRTDGIVLALALSLLAARRGELSGLLDGSHRPGRSAPSLQNFGEDLLRVPPDRLPHTAIRRIPPNAGAVLIGDFLNESEQTATMLDTLAARIPKGLMLQVLDPAEIELPFSGRVIFEEPGSGAEQHILNVESVRAAYRKRIDAHIETLQTLCRRHNWQWVLHRTDGSITDTLFKIWRILGNGGMRP